MQAYTWRHIDTNNTGTSKFTQEQMEKPLEYCTELDYLRVINRWNSIGRGAWQYWI